MKKLALCILLSACGGTPFQAGEQSDTSSRDAISDDAQTVLGLPDSSDIVSDGMSSIPIKESSADTSTQPDAIPDTVDASTVDASRVKLCCATYADPTNVQCIDRSGPPYADPLPCDDKAAKCGTLGCQQVGSNCAGSVVPCEKDGG